MGPRARHTPHHHSAMSGETGYHNRGIVIGTKISRFLNSLGPATYDEISPKIEFWIEYALVEQSVDADDLVDQLSSVTWDRRSSDADVARFLKEFRDAPHRSGQARSLVDNLCARVLRWFAAASAEDLTQWYWGSTYKLAKWGGDGFIRAASLVGHLIECGVLDHELVKRHLVKPLIAHHYEDDDSSPQHKSSRASAIYQLFVTAGDTLLHGLLEPEDVRVCFDVLNSQILLRGVAGLDVEKLEVICAACSSASRRNLNPLIRNFVRSTPHG